MTGVKLGCKATRVDDAADVIYFDSRRAAASYLQDEGIHLQLNTLIKKINTAINGSEQLFGFIWEEWINWNDEELPEGINISNFSFVPQYETRTIEEFENNTVDKVELQQLLDAANEPIKKERLRIWQESMDVKAVIYKNSPHLKTMADLRAEMEFSLPNAAIRYYGPYNAKAYNDLGELAVDCRQILRRMDLLEIVEHGTLCGYKIDISEEYMQKIRNLVKS